jgi:UDP-N-acetyl-D-glucosamine dehydrogenase
MITTFDVALVCTAHKAINYKELADWIPLIVDTRNALEDLNTNRDQV